MFDTYADGHRFEKRTGKRIEQMCEDAKVYYNVLMDKYPYYEMDILCIINNKVLLIECKDYRGTVMQSDNNIVYKEHHIPNISDRLRRKVKALKRFYDVDATGFIVVADSTGLNLVKNAIRLHELVRLLPVLHLLPDTNTSTLLSLLDDEKQLALRKERNFK